MVLNMTLPRAGMVHGYEALSRLIARQTRASVLWRRL